MKPDPEAIWAALPIATLVSDVDDRIFELNPAAELLLNASKNALIGRSALTVLGLEEDLAKLLQRLRRERSELLINDVEVSRSRRAPIPCNIHLSALQNGEGVILMVEPRPSKDLLTGAQTVKSAARSAIGMAEMMAHEIKNPLAGITGAAQLLSMSLPPDDLELTDLIVAESRRIVKLLEQVEQFGNLRPPERKSVNIHDLLDRARRSAEVGFAAKMKFIEDYDPSLPSTHADGDQMLQVFLNLLKNASEAAADTGGVIRLRTYYDRALRVRRQTGPGLPVPLQVEIVDDGPGLPDEIAENVFEPFVSGRENGTGLGLALVSKIISDHDGWISLNSQPGQTVFRISLPVAPKS